MLEKLSKHNVRINVDKCKFLVTEVKYLGHILCKGTIRPLQDKVIAIENASEPKNITELQAYLGLLNYYSQLLPNVSSHLK